MLRPRLISETGHPAKEENRHDLQTSDQLLTEARALLPRRPSSAQALAAQANGGLLVDIRGDDQRRGPAG
jgi:hypothetical protein